jgi:hypothetical protein
MRSLLITLAAGTAALVLSGCPDRWTDPVPVIQSSDTPAKTGSARHTLHEHAAHEGHSGHHVSEISWFQGTLDEAFSRRTCPQAHRALFSP